MENTQMYTQKEKLTRLYFNEVVVMADDVQREGEGKKKGEKRLGLNSWRIGDSLHQGISSKAA